MSLTDDWKAGELKNGWYYCRLKNGLIHHFEFNGKDFTDLTCHIAPVVEVLASCDYKEVQRLNKILKSVLESNEALAVNINELSRKIEAYQLSEKEAQEIIAELDYKNEQLRQLLKESIRLIGYEHEVYEAENFIKEVNEVLK